MLSLRTPWQRPGSHYQSVRSKPNRRTRRPMPVGNGPHLLRVPIAIPKPDISAGALTLRNVDTKTRIGARASVDSLRLRIVAELLPVAAVAVPNPKDGTPM